MTKHTFIKQIIALIMQKVNTEHGFLGGGKIITDPYSLRFSLEQIMGKHLNFVNYDYLPETKKNKFEHLLAQKLYHYSSHSLVKKTNVFKGIRYQYSIVMFDFRNIKRIKKKLDAVFFSLVQEEYHTRIQKVRLLMLSRLLSKSGAPLRQAVLSFLDNTILQKTSNIVVQQATYVDLWSPLSVKSLLKKKLKLRKEKQPSEIEMQPMSYLRWQGGKYA